MGQGEIIHSGEQYLPKESEVRDVNFTCTSPLFSAASLPLSKPSASPFQEMPPGTRSLVQGDSYDKASLPLVSASSYARRYFEVVASRGASLGLPPRWPLTSLPAKVSAVTDTQAGKCSREEARTLTQASSMARLS